MLNVSTGTEPQFDDERYRRELRESYRLPVPNDLLHASSHNATLGHCLELWRRGEVTLERALIAACVHLAEQNRRLMERAVMPVPSPVEISKP